MRPVEIIGTAAIGATCIATWHLGTHLPASVSLGAIALLATELLLAQQLLRELVLLLEPRRHRHGGRRRAPVGHSIALPLLVAMLALLFGSVDQPVLMTTLRWCIAMLAILGCGFVTQDFTLALSPLRLRHDPDHRLLALLPR